MRKIKKNGNEKEETEGRVLKSRDKRAKEWGIEKDENEWEGEKRKEKKRR